MIHIISLSGKNNKPATIGNNLSDKNLMITMIWPTADVWSLICIPKGSGIAEIHTHRMQEPEAMENWPLWSL